MSTSSQFPPPSPASLLASSSMRLWRPAAQRNLRNQWSKLSTFRQQKVRALTTNKNDSPATNKRRRRRV
ncbi:unnamed protein product, partial [Brassica oleracea var. botrytis]|uniref:Uncharacterized protein n=1 Tax=Brassica oleracea TaxID=3712 RepID=A0A3P6D8L3_BRAOL|nr:unnamed protein product [Brassica oleracea]